MTYIIKLNNCAEKYLKYRDKNNIYKSTNNFTYLALNEVYNYYNDIYNDICESNSEIFEIFSAGILTGIAKIFENEEDIYIKEMAKFFKNLFIICINI